jgi:probable addiction module antidote protein
MTKIKIRQFDAANYLENEDDIAEYFRFVLESGDVALLSAAIGDIARARGLSRFACETGLPR